MGGNDLLQTTIQALGLSTQYPCQRMGQGRKPIHLWHCCHHNASRTEALGQYPGQLVLPFDEAGVGHASGHVVYAERGDDRIVCAFNRLQPLERISGRVSGCRLKPPFDRVMPRQVFDQMARQRLILCARADAGGRTVARNQQAQARPTARSPLAWTDWFRQQLGLAAYSQALSRQNWQQGHTQYLISGKRN